MADVSCLLHHISSFGCLLHVLPVDAYRRQSGVAQQGAEANARDRKELWELPMDGMRTVGGSLTMRRAETVLALQQCCGCVVRKFTSGYRRFNPYQCRVYFGKS